MGVNIGANIGATYGYTRAVAANNNNNVRPSQQSNHSPRA